MDEAPKIAGVLEISLYAPDLTRTAGFYRDLFGFRSLVHFADNFGFSLRASAKGALASSISPFSTWAAATLR